MGKRDDLIDRIEELEWDLRSLRDEVDCLDDDEVAVDANEPITCHECTWLRIAGPTCGFTGGIIPAGFLSKERVREKGSRCGTPPPKPKEEARV